MIDALKRAFRWSGSRRCYPIMGTLGRIGKINLGFRFPPAWWLPCWRRRERTGS